METREVNIYDFWPDWYGSQKDFVFNFDFDDKQTPIFQLYKGGARAGKSVAVMRKAVVLSWLVPGSIAVVSRETYRSLHDTTMTTFFEQLPAFLLERYDRTDDYVLIKTKDPSILSTILFRSHDEPDKFGSMDLTYYVVDEARNMKYETYLMLKTRLSQKLSSYHFGLFASNPPTSDHYLYADFMLAKRPNYYLYTGNSNDNKSLSEGYLKELENLPTMIKESLLKGNWGMSITGKPVFPMFDSELHVRKIKYNPELPLYASFDYGYHHPSMILAQIDTNDTVYILDSLLGHDTYFEDFYDQVMEVFKKYLTDPRKTYMYLTGDIAGTQKTGVAKTNVETLRELITRDFGMFKYRTRHINISQSVKQIIRLMMARYRGLPKFIISDTLNNAILINAFLGGYHYPESTNHSSSLLDEPEKDGYYDHLVDCVRYLIGNYLNHVKITASYL